jgi:hypothetical protein
MEIDFDSPFEAVLQPMIKTEAVIRARTVTIETQSLYIVPSGQENESKERKFFKTRDFHRVSP